MALVITYGAGPLPVTAISAMDPAYGCVGNGIADDSVGFQAALTAASGKALFIPPVNKFLIGDVTPPGNTRIFGGNGAMATGASTLIAKPGCTRVLDCRDKYGITIENLFIDGAGAASYGIDASNSTLGGANQHRLTNIGVKATTVAALMLDNAGETEVRSCRTDLLTSGYAIRWLNQAGNSTVDGGSYFGGASFFDAQVMQVSNAAFAGIYISKACEVFRGANLYIYQRVNPGGAASCIEVIASPITPGASGVLSATLDTCRYVMKTGNPGEATSGAVIKGDFVYYLGFRNSIVDMAGSGSNPNFFDIASAGGAGILTMEYDGGRMTNNAGKFAVWNPDYSQYEVRETLTDGAFNFLSNMGVRSVRMREHADFAAPGADEAILYTRDNGAGKTQIVARFASGAIQVIATQP